MVKTLFALCIVSFSSLIMAGWIDRAGNPLPDTPSRKYIGDFGANLILTNKEHEAFRNWNLPSAGVELSTTDKIKKNEHITALVIFSGCGADKNGNCNLLVKFKILQPDGSIYADLPLQEVWVGKPAPGRALQLSVEYIKIVIESDEPLGVYEVQAKVIDTVLRKTINLSSKFEATN